MTTDPLSLVEFARNIAIQAGSIHRRYFRRLQKDQVRLKGRRDPVTRSDLEAEQTIVQAITDRFPDHGIQAEEGASQEGSSDLRWIIDPLDGTVNFTRGLPMYSVALAAYQGDEALASVVYVPEFDELYSAARGHGTTLNGEALQVSECPDVHSSLLATGFCYERNEVADDNVDHFSELVLRCHDIRRLGSASLDFALLAAGRYDGYWELHLSPWDIAPGALLVQEAGGTVTDFDGGNRMIETKCFVASNGRFHEELRQILRARHTPEVSSEEPGSTK